MPTQFTEKQGQYLAFIDSYMTMNGRAPAEADLERFFRTTPPTIHQMILTLEAKGFISRVPGQPRSIGLLIDPGQIPRLKRPGLRGGGIGPMTLGRREQRKKTAHPCPTESPCGS